MLKERIRTFDSACPNIREETGAGGYNQRLIITMGEIARLSTQYLVLS